MSTSKVKAIAIHLPQYHPIPENDLWWGKGFTEWTNVVKASPLFKGHYQPHLPGDLGFYDLRLSESRVAQAELAKNYGIHGFCYYHYWFNGKRLLNAPLDGILQTQAPDFPFMLCWANENWTRRWDGTDDQVLIKQDYSPEDDFEHIRFLLTNVFRDRRYIRIDNKPFILLYRPQLFPDISATLKIWRSEAERLGEPGLHIGYMQSFGFKEDPKKLGFDCAVEFEPDFPRFPKPELPTFQQRLLHKMRLQSSAHYSHNIFSYKKYLEIVKSNMSISDNVYKSITPMWDNSARRKKYAWILIDSTPELYEEWLRLTVDLTNRSSDPNKFVFINAWNEWAEGNHLEPCQKWGLQYLQATKRALDT